MYSNFVFVPSTFDLFNYGTLASLYLLETCQFFSRNFTFDSHRDLKLSRIQESVKFKYFSRSMDSQILLSRTFQDCPSFSFSSLCKPCLKDFIKVSLIFQIITNLESSLYYILDNPCAIFAKNCFGLQG